MKFQPVPIIPETSSLKSIASGRAEVFKLDPRLIERESGFNKRYDFGDLQVLANDILENGVLESLKVRKEGTRVFLVNGDRRLSAIEILLKEGTWPEDPKNPGYPTPIPCTSEGPGVKPLDRIFMMLSLNTGKPFTLLEKGLAYQEILLHDHSINASEIARRSGETKQAVSNALQIINHASPALIDHIKADRVSATTALSIIKTTDGHDEQNAAAAKAIGAAKESGKDHATPKHLPAKKKPAKIEADWTITESTPDWDKFPRCTDGSTVKATGAKWDITIIEIRYAKRGHEWFAGFRISAGKKQDPKADYTIQPVSALRDGFPTADAAILSEWPTIHQRLTAYAAGRPEEATILSYLEILGSRLQAISPCHSVTDTDPTAGAYIADPNDDDEADDAPWPDSEEPQTSIAPGSTTPDPSAFDRLRNASSSNRDGSSESSGGGSGYATADKRAQNLENLLDELDKDNCHTQRWDTIELILDYLNGNHTVTTIKKHLLS